MTKALRYTFFLVLLSVLFSIASLSTSRVGWGEMYPFFYWKLYSQPIGREGGVENIRVYAKNTFDEHWTRVANKNYQDIDPDEHNYFLGYHALQVENQTSEAESSKKRLLIFAGYIAPEYDHYKIVKELHRPQDILNGNDLYSTEDLVVFETK